jgi:hypothetical protein
VAIDNQARTKLLALNETDIARIAGIPGLGESWAKLAKTSHGDLVRGTQRARRALKASILRDSHDYPGIGGANADPSYSGPAMRRPAENVRYPM